MDTVKFIEERNRMCRSFDAGCQECPAFSACECEDELCSCAVGHQSTIDATAQIAIVEEWAAAHPRKTRQSVFLEHYPETSIGKNGVLLVCPCPISASHRNADGGCATIGIRCDDCRKEYWMQEVE